MKAVMLAAGVSSRLQPLTANTPKCLLDVAGKPILQRTIDNILANNIKDIIIVTGYLQHQVKDFVSSTYPGLEVTYIYNELYTSTNNIYSLWLTKEHIAGNDMLLMDSDIIFDKEIIAELLKSNYANCLALKKHNVHDEEIKVKADANGRVLEIGKEVKLSEAIGESIGIEKFGKEAIHTLFTILDRKMLVDKKVNQFYEAAFEEMVQTGTDIFIVDTTGNICMEIDTLSDLETARELLLTGK